jgi:hypothetical protein
MKKNFTLPLFLLIFSAICHEPLHAQAWLDQGNDSSEIQGNYFNNITGLAMALDTAGLPYIFRVMGTPPTDPSFTGGVVLLDHFDGANWSTSNSSVYTYPGVVAGLVDRSNNVYMGSNDGNPLPEVYKYAANAWSRVGAGLVNDNSANSFSLAVDTTGALYYGYYGSGSSRPQILKFNGTTWLGFDTTGLVSGSGGQIVALAVDRHNSLYAAYDEANPATGQPAFLIVEKYTGTGWVRVGTSTLYSTEAQNILAFDSNNTPYILSATGNNSVGNNFQLEELSGGDWTPVGPAISPVSSQTGSPASRNYAGVTQLYLVIGAGNTPYVGWCQSANSFPAVDKFNGTAWVPAGSNQIAQDPIMGSDMSLAGDQRGNLYTVYIDIYSQATHVKKLEGRAADTITFPYPYINKIYGDSDFTLQATSNNTDPGDPIQYSISDTTVATFVNGKIHILNAGVTYITASQPADANYLAAQPVTIQLAVTPAAQTITFPGWPQKKVGDPDFAAGGYATSGLPVTYDGSDPTIATVTPDGTIHIIEQGAIIVTAHQTGSNNYQPAPDVAQVLIITDSTVTDTTGSSSGGGKGKIFAFCTSRSSLQVEITPPVDGPARLDLYNSFGYRVYSKEINLSLKGGDTYLIPVGNLPPGIYFVRVMGSSYSLIQPIWIR